MKQEFMEAEALKTVEHCRKEGEKKAEYKVFLA